MLDKGGACSKHGYYLRENCPECRCHLFDLQSQIDTTLDELRAKVAADRYGPPAGDTYAISMEQAQVLCGHEKTVFPQVCATGACWVPPTPARKDDAGKPDMTLITYSMVAPAATVLKFGEKKYGRLNYRNPNPGFEQRLIAAALRHLLQHTDGQELDNESNEPHLAHALTALMLVFDRRAHAKEGEEL